MTELKAFVGHSFTENDKEVVRQFTDFFDNVKNMGIGFSWAHAEPAEPKVLSEKVLELMEGKNLFIAICTVKELVTVPDKLKKILFNRNMLKVKSDELEKKTSDWVIQEIGVAVGRKMDVILLLEEGIRNPGGLQGDMDYIAFTRDEPSKSFNKIIEMLTALSPKEAQIKTSPLEPSVKTEVEVMQHDKKEKVEATTGWKRRDYEYALFRAISKNEKEQEQKIIKDYINSDEGKNDLNIASFEALKYYFRGVQEKGAYVEELKSMCNKHTDNSDIIYYLGKAYEQYKDNDKAAIQYEKAAECSQNSKEKLNRFCDAALAKSSVGFKDTEYWLINKVRDLAAFVEDGLFRLFETLKKISEIEKKNDKYLAYSESMLDISPDDEDLRFALAYKYSMLEKNELALFHYLLIPNKERSSAVWHNIGVARSNLGINGEAVDAYREAEKMGETLAMSNLSHKLIKAGFLKEAEEICDKAIKIENYDKHIGTAITSIKTTKEEEGEKEKKILEDNEKRRKFYIDYGKACIKKLYDNCEGIWIGSECELNVEVKERSFIAQGSYEKKKLLGRGLMNYYAVGIAPQTEKTVKINVRYEGVLTGYGIEFKFYVEEEGEKSTLLTAFSGKEPSKEGLMIISDDMKKIRVYEKGTKETEKFYEFQKK